VKKPGEGVHPKIQNKAFGRPGEKVNSTVSTFGGKFFRTITTQRNNAGFFCFPRFQTRSQRVRWEYPFSKHALKMKRVPVRGPPGGLWVTKGKWTSIFSGNEGFGGQRSFKWGTSSAAGKGESKLISNSWQNRPTKKVPWLTGSG